MSSRSPKSAIAALNVAAASRYRSGGAIDVREHGHQRRNSRSLSDRGPDPDSARRALVVGASGMTARFEAQVVLVAGGTGALGSAVAQAFLDVGATVVVTQHSAQDPTHAGAQRLRVADAARLQVATLDAGDEAAVQALVDDLAARHGRIDVLVNAVGGYAGGKALRDTDLVTFERMLAINLRAAFVLSRAVVPKMQAQRRGAIVNVAARAALDPPAAAAAYAASKAGVLALMASLAAELSGSGVRVNTVLPKTIDTPANRQAMPGASRAGWTSPESIARVILFLCSEDAQAVHGAAIPVYGGG
jgi:NAD(P)-dependent dehydrogenase (short-subunit alcohol dehydrogenase family)